MLTMRTLAAALCATLLALLPSAEAQDADWPGFALLRTTQVVPGQYSEYDAFLRRIAEAAAKTQSPQGINVQTAAIGEGGLYTIISFHTDFTDLGGSAVAEQAFGATPWREMVAGLTGVVARTNVQIFFRRPDLSRMTPDLDPSTVPLWHVFMLTARPGKEPQLEEWLTKQIEATDKVAPSLYWFGYSPGFNTGPVYRVAAPLTFEGLNEPVPNAFERIEQAFDRREAQRLAALFSDSVESVEDRLMRHRPDLSYYPSE